MNRALVALPVVAVLVAAAWPSTRAEPAAGRGGLCDQMTPARLLENPALADEYAQALRSGDAAEVARVRAEFEQIRSAHGCTGDVTLPDAAPAPRLPPGHPPIAPGQRPEGSVLFEQRGNVTI